MRNKFLLLLIVLNVCFLSCRKDEKSNLKAIISFILSEQTSEAIFDPEKHEVVIIVAYESDLTQLIPLIEVSKGAGSKPASGEVTDFSEGFVNYIVTAEDGSTQEWKVIVVINKSSDAEILSFTMEGQKNDAVIAGDSIVVEVNPGLFLTNIVPEITISSGASIYPTQGTAVDLSGRRFTYTVTANDSTFKEWIIIIQKDPFYENKMISFTVSNQMGETVFDNTIIYVEVPFNSDLSAIVPEIVVSNYATVSPASGEPVDFSQGKVLFTVTSEEGYNRFYYVHVNYGLITADHEYYQYTGRISFANPKKPVFYAPGVYIKAKYKGSNCEIAINDQNKWGSSRNYLEIIIDDTIQQRIQTSGLINNIRVGEGLAYGEHTIAICKDTEAGIGYLEFLGLRCEELLPLSPKPTRKIEFIGNSITCGTGSDLSVVACGAGQWYDQHNAYMSYGPSTARVLNSQWHLSSVSGIGLVHSCCDMTVLMPDVFDKINMGDNSGIWDFNKYIPDVVTICLGQNDGIQDSSFYCNAYINFIKTLRSHYPDAHIICLTSPMANDALRYAMKNYLTGIVAKINNDGDNKVYKYFFSKSFNSGCDTHPDLAEHKIIAEELTGFIKSVTGW